MSWVIKIKKQNTVNDTMVKKITVFILTVFGLLMAGSCKNTACKDTNAVFNKYSPDSKEYKDELIRQLNTADKSNLSWHMAAYWTENQHTPTPQEYIVVKIEDGELCADMVLAIRDSRKGIENILHNKMLGYRGAELKDLQFDIYQDSSKTEFVFREVSGISD